MPSPYELAFLSNHAYRDDVRQMNRTIEIPDEGSWGIEMHNGISADFFCTKYIKVETGESVIAFRGTGGRTADLTTDFVHLYARHSEYIDRAWAFLRNHGNSETIVTGHSLGGFISISMAFMRQIRVVAFNPPWMISDISAAIDNIRALRSDTFQASPIIVYQSNTDVVTGATHGNRIRTSNVRFVRVGALGWHNIQPILDNFRRNRSYEIRFQ